MAAISVDLHTGLFGQDRAPHALPARRRTQFRQHAAGGVQRKALPKQMGVRAEIARQMPLDMLKLRLESQKEIEEPGTIRVWIVFERYEEVERPYPGDRTKRELQHACPINAQERRIAVEPALQLSTECRCVSRIAGQPSRASEHQPVLMTIQFPYDLVIADPRVETGNAGPELSRRVPPMDRIRVPVDLTIACMAYDITVSQKVVPPLDWARRVRHGLIGSRRERLQDGKGNAVPRGRIEDEPTLARQKVRAKCELRLPPRMPLQSRPDTLKGIRIEDEPRLQPVEQPSRSRRRETDGLRQNVGAFSTSKPDLVYIESGSTSGETPKMGKGCDWTHSSVRHVRSATECKRSSMQTTGGDALSPRDLL